MVNKPLIQGDSQARADATRRRCSDTSDIIGARRLGGPENLKNQDGVGSEGVRGAPPWLMSAWLISGPSSQTSALHRRLLLTEDCGRADQRGIPTVRGGMWSAVQVKRVLERLTRLSTARVAGR